MLPVFLLFLYISTSYGQNEKKFIRKGNGMYSDGKYPDSEISYRKALDVDKSSGDAIFNLGDALYKQNKYDEAGKQFLDNAQVSDQNSRKADSYYNLGNSLLKSQKLKESIEAYKNSLRLRPDNPEAKYNLAYAQDMLKLQEQQQQQQQNQEQKENKDQKKEDPKQDNKNQDQQQPKDDQQQKQQQQQQQISREDAQRLLDALANDEKKVQEKVKEAKAAKARVKTLINW